MAAATMPRLTLPLGPVGVEYRHLPGFRGYAAGSDGSLWTCLNRDREWRRRKTRGGRKRYLRVNVWLGGRLRTFNLHTLILLAFRGPCPPGMECRHLNGDPTDNRAENLAWGTKVENAEDRDRHGTSLRGEKNHKAKLTREQVEQVWELYLTDDLTQVEVASFLGLPRRAVQKVLSGEKWRWLLEERLTAA